jgi:putative flippase GtrA
VSVSYVARCGWTMKRQGQLRFGDVLALLGYVALGIPVGLVMLALAILSFPLALGAMVVRRLRPSSK